MENVMPIYKKDQKEDEENYRLVSLNLFHDREDHGTDHPKCHHVTNTEQPGDQAQPAEVCERPIKVPLDGILALQHANLTIQIDAIVRLAEGVLKPTVHVKTKMLKSAGPNTDY
ncbi:hypothetical protein BTVI_08779 [Pitangus sulphuratus]|nr:hypothetical protein BTVI_08779 [Pitangus sulphuratus]